MDERDAPAVYLSKRFYGDFAGGAILAGALFVYLGIPYAVPVALAVAGISAVQAQRRRVRQRTKVETLEAAESRRAVSDADADGEIAYRDMKLLEDDR